MTFSWATVSTRAMLRHHCFSQGTPSPSPSIFTPGQFSRKYVASSQEVICEQWVRPSQRNRELFVFHDGFFHLPDALRLSEPLRHRLRQLRALVRVHANPPMMIPAAAFPWMLTTPVSRLFQPAARAAASGGSAMGFRSSNPPRNWRDARAPPARRATGSPRARPFPRDIFWRKLPLPFRFRGLTELHGGGAGREHRKPDVVPVEAREIFPRHAARRPAHGAEPRAFVRRARRAQPHDAHAHRSFSR